MKAFALCFALFWIGINRLPAATSAAANMRDARAEALLTESLNFSEKYWDDSVALLWSPGTGEAITGRQHGVRNSIWYALGLLERGGEGDLPRACRVIEAMLAQQYDEPGRAWNGTYRRTSEEPAPPLQGAVSWEHFDPNWRQFIGATFAQILIDHEVELPKALCARMEASIARAVEGELAAHRLTPNYTNIAIMHGFLLGYAGQRLGRPAWREQGDAWAEQVRALYAGHQTFDEYNSPTYYGVDLYGLALWRRYGATEKIRALGAEMEAGLWRDIASFYHAGLRNLSGPFDRSYGMDMRRYVALTGMWIGLALDDAHTPLPARTGAMEHGHDFMCMPTYVALGTKIPADVLVTLREFPGEHQVERVITADRVATAWLSPNLMLGGEATHFTRAAGPKTHYHQFHPATAYWRVGASDVGWLVLSQCPEVDAKASPGMLTITTAKGESIFRIAAPGLDSARLQRDDWSLPNLNVRVETDASGFAVTAGDGFVDVAYREATRLVLHAGVTEK